MPFRKALRKRLASREEDCSDVLHEACVEYSPRFSTCVEWSGVESQPVGSEVRFHLVHASYAELLWIYIRRYIQYTS